VSLVTEPFDFDDHIMSRTRSDQITRVRVYEWPDVSVVIGRGGKQDLELIPQNIVNDGVKLYKRPGGGCSVVLDPGNLVVSVAVAMPGLGGIKSAFSAVSEWIIGCLFRCGVPGVTQHGVSDLVIGERKIGGSCIYRTKGLLYYSTTLLVNHDPEHVGRYLKHPPREPEYRRGRPHHEFMVSLRELGLAEDPGTLRPILVQELNSNIEQLGQNSGFLKK
jgi:lipoate---protein ligase